MDLLAHGEIACKAFFGLVFEDAVCNFVRLFEDISGMLVLLLECKRRRRPERYLYLFRVLD
jgi:hypothetical protein